LRPYCLENGIFTPLIGTKTPSEQCVKPGAHLLFTRAPKDTLDPMKYQPDGRPRRAEAQPNFPRPLGSPTSKHMPGGLPGINAKQGMTMGMAMSNVKRQPSLADSANGLKR